MVGVQTRRNDAANAIAPASGGTNAAAVRSGPRRRVIDLRRRLSRVRVQCAQRSARCDHYYYLHLRLYAVETRQHIQHRTRRGAGSIAANDWLGSGARNAQRGSMDAFCDPVLLATAAFLRDRMDVSRRLHPRRLPNDLER